MADTPRTYAQLQAILPDNASGQLSPQDLRDFLASVRLPFACYYISVPTATTIAVPSTYYKVSGTTVLEASRDFTQPQNNRVLYGGTPTRDVKISVMGNGREGGGLGGDDISFRVAKNGTSIANSQNGFVTSTVTQALTFSLQWWETGLTTGDYLEIYTTNNTDTNSVLVNEMVVIVEGMLT